MEDLSDTDCSIIDSILATSVYMSEEQYDDVEEVIVHEDQIIDGDILFVEQDDDFGLACNKKPAYLTSDLRTKLHNLQLCVGKLFSIYEAEENGPKPKVFGGSGFWISPCLVLTAKHVVKRSRSVDGFSFVLKKLLLVMKSTVDNFQILDDWSDEPSVFQLELDFVPDDADDTFVMVPGSDESKWKTNSDFAFLKSSRRFKRFATFKQPKNQQLSIVIGYPGCISEDKFIEDYTKDMLTKDKKPFYEVVMRAMRQFNKRTISINTDSTIHDDHIIRHKSPTLRGTSGGLFVDLATLAENDQPVFTGIHIGGCWKIYENFAFSNQRPSLKAKLEEYDRLKSE